MDRIFRQREALTLKLRRSHFVFYPNGVSSYSPGLRGLASYPGKRCDENDLPQRGYAIRHDAASNGTTPFGVDPVAPTFTQGSPPSRATLGYKA
jgi:hypothetical protein